MLLRQIASTPAAKSIYSAEVAPGPTVQTDNDFRTFVESNYRASVHLIGTAAMLPKSLGGVVDSKLRVYGVQGVRVVGKLFYASGPSDVVTICVLYVLCGRCFDHSTPNFGSSFFYCVWDS